MKFAVAINVMPRSEISDPQGQTIENALPGLGFEAMTSVRVGKRITLVLDAPDRDTAETLATKACETFLTNPIIEEFEIQIGSAPEAANPPKTTGGLGGVAAPLGREPRAPEAANPSKTK